MAGAASSRNTNLEGVPVGILHAVLLQLCSCLRDLDPLDACLHLELFHQALWAPEATVVARVLMSFLI